MERAEYRRRQRRAKKHHEPEHWPIPPAERYQIGRYLGEPGTFAIYKGIEFPVDVPDPKELATLTRCVSCRRGIYLPGADYGGTALCVGCAIEHEVKQAVKGALAIVQEEDALEAKY